MNIFRFNLILTLAIACSFCATASAQEKDTLPPLVDGSPAPQNFAEMWAGFDPRAEPLEIETIKQWEEDDVILRIVRFRIGVFKGQKAILAGVYGFPKSAVGGKKIPGLLQIHGGGQYADHKACLANAKLGYATISISWAGRISATEYRVNPEIVKLFWDGKTEDPKYKLTTDWGALDGYHAPCRNKKNNFPSATPHEWTIDQVESPRNSPWFICALAARRALTFLEQQPEVDGDRLGVYGHSMGGKLTVMTSVDPRVKAAAPSCGGISDRDNKSELFRQTIGDDVSLKQIKCPIVFLSPANDFHGRIGDLPATVEELATDNWRVTCSPHRSHKDMPENEVATLLWFDQHLKGKFEFPQTPQTKLVLKPEGSEFNIEVDPNHRYSRVDVFFTQNGKQKEISSDREITKNRFWHHVNVEKSGESLVAQLSGIDPEKPLWVYANVLYPLESPVSGAGYYYGAYTADNYNLSSLLTKISPSELKAAGVKFDVKSVASIEDFKGDWKTEWYCDKPNDWRLSTHKVFDQKYAAPLESGAKLAFQVRCNEPNSLLVLLDERAAEVQLKGDGQWQNIQLSPTDFKNFEDEPRSDFNDLKTFSFKDAHHLRGKERSQRRVVGKKWTGDDPEFQNLRWTVVE